MCGREEWTRRPAPFSICTSWSEQPAGTLVCAEFPLCLALPFLGAGSQCPSILPLSLRLLSHYRRTRHPDGCFSVTPGQTGRPGDPAWQFPRVTQTSKACYRGWIWQHRAGQDQRISQSSQGFWRVPDFCTWLIQRLLAPSEPGCATVLSVPRPWAGSQPLAVSPSALLGDREVVLGDLTPQDLFPGS